MSQTLHKLLFLISINNIHPTKFESKIYILGVVLVMETPTQVTGLLNWRKEITL